MNAAQVEGQLGMDETQLTDPALEAALEERQTARDSYRQVLGVYREKHDIAKGLIESNVPEGIIARVGRFRIERKPTGARHVEFDTHPGVRVTIEADGDD